MNPRATWVLFCLLVIVAHVQGQEAPPSSSKATRYGPRHAWVSFVANDGYSDPARVLAASLLASGTTKELVVMVTEEVSSLNRLRLKEAGWTLVEVAFLRNPFLKEGRDVIFTKLQVWNLTQFEKIVFLDADIVVLHNADHLFECGQGMCGNMGTPYRNMFNFNVGVMVLKPSSEMLKDMLDMALVVGTNSKFGEAGFLNKYFLHWCRHGSLLSRLPRDVLSKLPLEEFQPPEYHFDPFSSKPISHSGRCYALPDDYNYRWGSKVGDSLIGFVANYSEYSDSIAIVHYAGPLKPWLWKYYPLHGWISVWHKYADMVPGIYDEIEYLDYVLLPLSLPLIFLALIYTPGVASILAKILSFTPIGRSRKGRFAVAWKVFSMCLTGMLPLLFAPFALYWWDILPPILPPKVGIFLFIEWSLLIYWAFLLPYCLYHYLLGIITFDALTNWLIARRHGSTPPTGSATSTLSKDERRAINEWLLDQHPWLEYASLIPDSFGPLTALALYSLGYAFLLSVMIFSLWAFFPWSASVVRFVVVELFGGVLIFFFLFFPSGLPRMFFLAALHNRKRQVAVSRGPSSEPLQASEDSKTTTPQTTTSKPHQE